MDEIIALLILVSEMLMILQCLQIAFRKKLKFDKYMFGLLGIDCVIYMLINTHKIHQVCGFILYILIYVYCIFNFRQNAIRTSVGMIIGLSLAAMSQVLVSCAVSFLESGFHSRTVLLILSCASLVLVHGIRKGVERISGRNKKVKKRDFFILVMVLSYGMVLVGLLIDYYWKKSLMNIYAAFILTFLMLIFVYLAKWENVQNEVYKKDDELRIREMYDETYKNLLKEVRERQHDFKNQLGAVYSMHLVANSLEELVSMQKEYGNVLLEECKFDSILTRCENSVLAGYLYYKCNDCVREGIEVEYDIRLQQADCAFALHEIIEVLGILIDNACENFYIEQNENRNIKLDFKEDEHVLKFSVANPAKYMTSSEIEKLFMPGYSKKGKNRGLGLARVLELVNQYGAEIHVFNYEHQKENWINFAIEIQKNEVNGFSSNKDEVEGVVGKY